MIAPRALAVAALLLTVLHGGAHAQASDTLRLTVGDAVERTLEQSEETRIAAAQVSIASAQLTIARASVLPQLRATGGYTHVDASARAQAVGSIFNQPNTYSVATNLSQPLFQGGRAIAGWRAATGLRSAAGLSVEETRAQLTLTILRAYLDALFAGRLVEIQEANAAAAAAQLRRVQQLESAGRAARYDVLRARVQLANVEPLVIQARGDRELAILELKRLVNVPPEQPVALASALDVAALPALVERIERLETTERASVRAAEFTAQARRQAVRVAAADRLPTLSAFVNVGAQAFPRTNTLPPLEGRVETVDCAPGAPPGRACTLQNGGFFSDRSFGLQMSWPVFDGLRTRGNIQLAQAQATLAELELARTREAAAVDVATTRAELTRARALFAASRQNAAEAAEALRLAVLRFERGLGTQLDVTDARLALLTAEINEARATSELYLSVAGLAHAAGTAIPLPPSRAAGVPSTSIRP